MRGKKSKIQKPHYHYITCPECGNEVKIDKNEFTNVKEQFYMFEPESVNIDFCCNVCDYYMSVRV